MKLINSIREEAKKKSKNIVLPESHDERVLKGAAILLSDKITRVTLIGNEAKIKKHAAEIGVHLDGATFYDPETWEQFDVFAQAYYAKRKHKGMTIEEARQIMKDVTFFGAMLVDQGMADGCLSGADTSTGNVMRAALHIIGTAPGVKTVSSDFIMITPDESKIWSFADCAVMPDPTAEQLADIAISSADTHKKVVGEEPRVAMLSFSTKGSAKHSVVDKVIAATRIVKEKRPDIMIDGELQADAAIVAAVGSKKAPGSNVAGKANVLVFPDLSAGNIGYKLVQRIAGCEAVGPIIQGLAKPLNDLSRGCSVDDIVNVSAILANMCD
ncbi:MAG: phosphate acetyltransferase [Candidatus Marinimicrobia bacterium]|nr:phosphate acetyltransferase [Candidatus Neomarinimicrobiota bacterium]